MTPLARLFIGNCAGNTEFNCSDQWYKHVPRKVEKNEEVKILWDFNIQTDGEIHHWRPDIVVQRKKERETIIVDIGVPGDC